MKNMNVWLALAYLAATAYYAKTENLAGIIVSYILFLMFLGLAVYQRVQHDKKHNIK